MSAKPPDEAAARLNYFNGQRLAAADFRSEQSYHIAMRRVLNRSLYSAGIVSGLEVEPDGSEVHRVVVREGLAFDHLGREIFVPSDVSVLVSGRPSAAPGVVIGNLLAVSYRETRAFPAESTCTLAAPYRAHGKQLQWGAPTRIVADAVFEVLDTWPAADSGKVVLAQIELSPTCEVVRCSSSVRKYAVPVKAGKTRVLSLVGDSDVAESCPKILHFHIADGLPERAQLYLRGGKLTPLWYSELAKHGHALTVDVKGGSWTVDFDHSHSLEGITDPGGAHRHAFWVANENEQNAGGFRVAENSFDNTNSIKIADNDPTSPLLLREAHTHELSEVTVGEPNPSSYTITPDFSDSGIADTGMEPGLRAGDPYTYFKELTVRLDGTPVTEKILEQLPSLAQLGVGESTTPDSEIFVTDGTPVIDVLLLGVDLLPGAHKLEFRVPRGKGGGKLFYELYVD
jgi:hypothetical protein